MGWHATRAQLPPIWVDRLDGVEDDIRSIQLKMRKLSGLHTKRLIVTFDADADLAIEINIELVTLNITKLFRHAENELRRLAGWGTQRSTSTGLISADEKVRNNVQHATAHKLQNLSMTFRRSQKDYLRRIKAQKEGLGGDFDFLDKNIQESEVGRMGMGGPPDSINEAQMAVLEQTEQYVQERDVETRNIVKSIEELSIIFKELAVLVIDQGTVLDRIDFNMEQVVESTTVGVQQLREAEEKQRNATPRKCIGVLFILIAVMLIILIIKYTS